MNHRLGTMLKGIALAAVIVASTLPLAAQGYENQPNMTNGLKELREAREALQRASSDKGGHRARAIRLIEQAEREVQLGIQYDNQHGSRGEHYGQYGGGQYGGGRWNGRLPADDQARFDSYYSRWLEYRRTNNREEIESMEKRMRDVMSRNNIPSNVPFDQIATRH